MRWIRHWWRWPPPGLHRKRRIAAAAAVALLGLGAAAHAGQSDYPPCSRGWHEAAAELVTTYGPCVDRGARLGCVPVPGATPRPLAFSLPSCVRDRHG